MTWNMSFSLITAAMLSILLSYYAVYPRLPFILNRFFVSLALSEMLTLISDIISTWMDINHQEFPLWMLYTFNLLFFMAFVLRSYATYAYTTAMVGAKRKVAWGYKLTGWIIVILSWLFMACSTFTGSVFYIDQDGYHSGPFYNVLYVQLFLFLILGLIVLIRYRREISDGIFCGMLACYAILITGAFFRYVFPHFLLMDTFYMLAIMILYLTIHNVDLYRESRTMLFDYQAFDQVVREHHNIGIWYHLIGIMCCNYKETRQIYGGDQMDRVLGQIGKYLRDTFPHSTVFYERSGCFLILTKGREASEKVVAQIYPKAAARLREPWDTGEATLFLNFVFGQMNSDLEIHSVDMLLEAVRNILEEGANGNISRDFVLDQLMIEGIQREFAVKKALSDALHRNEVQVYMQPIIEAKTGKVIGAEALSRLVDPKLGLIPPAEFIPIAERSRSIIRLGEQVLEKTCRFLRDNADTLSGLDFININLSPIQCLDHNLAGTFDRIPKACGVDPGRLHLEITEESMVDPELLKNQMEQLGESGYSFYLDDYGSGYANQFRIRSFPFSGIKLDMQIVWAHFRDPDAILPNTISTFLDRGLSVTAEGVETKEMAEQLTQMGCTYLQGFYFSKPVPMSEFLDFVLLYSTP